MSASASDAYLDLVIRIVRGESPIREHAARSATRLEEAERHLARLREAPPADHASHPMFQALMTAGAPMLAAAWARMSPPALTMCGEASIANVVACIETVTAEGVRGDFLEAGVWRGGLPIVMRAFLEARIIRDRRVWVADSFRGLPSAPQDARDAIAHVFMEPILHLAVSRADVEQAFAFFGLLDDQVRILEGWFADTLPTAPIESLALLRLDGDYYESTDTTLKALYPKVSVGGFVIVDDYNLPLGCRDAVDGYRKRFEIDEPIVPINNQAVFWRKQRHAKVA